MGVEATRAVWRFSQSRGTARLVLLAIADNADDSGLAWPGHSTIAEKCLISRRAVIDNLRLLEQSEELAIVHRRNAGNVYLIRLGELPEIHGKHHQQPRYKCRFCTLVNVNDSVINVQIRESYVQISSPNVKPAAHEPSEPLLNRKEPSGPRSLTRGKPKGKCSECGSHLDADRYCSECERVTLAS